MSPPVVVPDKATVLLVGVFCKYVSAVMPVVLMDMVFALIGRLLVTVPIAPVIGLGPVPKISKLVLPMGRPMGGNVGHADESPVSLFSAAPRVCRVES